MMKESSCEISRNSTIRPEKIFDLCSYISHIIAYTVTDYFRYLNQATTSQRSYRVREQYNY